MKIFTLNCNSEREREREREMATIGIVIEVLFLFSLSLILFTETKRSSSFCVCVSERTILKMTNVHKKWQQHHHQEWEREREKERKKHGSLAFCFFSLVMFLSLTLSLSLSQLWSILLTEWNHSPNQSSMFNDCRLQFSGWPVSTRFLSWLQRREEEENDHMKFGVQCLCARLMTEMQVLFYIFFLTTEKIKVRRKKTERGRGRNELKKERTKV